MPAYTIKPLVTATAMYLRVDGAGHSETDRSVV